MRTVYVKFRVRVQRIRIWGIFSCDVIELATDANCNPNIPLVSVFLTNVSNRKQVLEAIR